MHRENGPVYVAPSLACTLQPCCYLVVAASSETPRRVLLLGIMVAAKDIITSYIKYTSNGAFLIITLAIHID